MAAYAQAHLRPGAPLEADAITVSPYLGASSLDPAVELALDSGKGLFMLALTSNPDGPRIQHARDFHDTPVARQAPRTPEAGGPGTENRGGRWGWGAGGTAGAALRPL